MSARRATPASLAVLVTMALALAPAAASAQSAATPVELEGVDVYEHLNGAVPGDAIFRDHLGNMVTLGSFFDGRRPVVLNLVYHRCSMLCSLVLNAVVNGLRNTQWTVGEQYQVVTLSLDPRDTPAVAADARARRLSEYGRPGAERGWHFLIGDETNIRRVAAAVGFSYRYDTRQNEFAHPAVTMLLTPSGHVARYLYGIEYNPRDLRLGLLEASEGRSITTVERVLLWCFHYDPVGRRYVLVARQIMKLGGLITMVGLAGFLLYWWRRDRRRARTARQQAALVDPMQTPVASLTPAPDSRG